MCKDLKNLVVDNIKASFVEEDKGEVDTGKTFFST